MITAERQKNIIRLSCFKIQTNLVADKRYWQSLKCQLNATVEWVQSRCPEEWRWTTDEWRSVRRWWRLHRRPQSENEAESCFWWSPKKISFQVEICMFVMLTPFKLQIKTFKNEGKLDRKIRYCNLQSICCCKQINFFSV